jgi:outer membrane protein TolC
MARENITLSPLSPVIDNDSLNRYIGIAAEANPSVTAARLTWEAALEKLPQAGALSDPTLEAGVFTDPMELTQGRQLAQFRLMQMFSWPGSRKAARTEAQHMANMAFEEFREARDNIILEVYMQWYALCATRQKIIHSRDNLRWLGHMESLALRKYASIEPATEAAYKDAGGNMPQSPAVTMPGDMNMGSGAAGAITTVTTGSTTGTSVGNPANSASGGMQMMDGGADGMADVLGIQLEAMEMESRLESLEAEMEAGMARFNMLLNRPAATTVVLPDSLACVVFTADMERLSEEISDNNPMLAMLREEGLAFKAKAGMERKMGYPMIGAGLQYMLMAPLKNTPSEPAQTPSAMSSAGTMSSAMASMDGKDMLMPMLTVSLPIYRNRYRAAEKESLLRSQAADNRYAAAVNNLEAELHRSLFLINDAGRKIDLYRRQAALAETSATLASQDFVTGRGGMEGVIRVLRLLLDYRLREAEAIAAYNTAAAGIQRLITYGK